MFKNYLRATFRSLGNNKASSLITISGLSVGMAVAMLTFGDRVAAEVERKRSQLVVGLDPMPDVLPVELRDGSVDIPRRIDGAIHLPRTGTPGVL